MNLQITVLMLLGQMLSPMATSTGNDAIIPTPQPKIENLYETKTSVSFEEVEKEIQYQQYLEELEIQIQKDMEELAKEQERARQAQLEEERKANITRVYYTSSDVSQPSNLTSDELEKAFEGTYLAGLGQYFIEAEQEHGINAVFLASIGALESGWGKSDYAQNRNNLFGYGAYDSNPDNAFHFSSKREGILTVGEKLSNNYLNSSGKYYNGSTPSGVNVMYCSQSDWAGKVVTIMNKIMDSIPY